MTHACRRKTAHSEMTVHASRCTTQNIGIGESCHMANRCRLMMEGKVVVSPSLASWLAGLLPAASSGQPGWCTFPSCPPPCLRSEPTSQLAIRTMPSPVQVFKPKTIASSRTSVYLAVKHSHSCHIAPCQATSPMTKVLFHAQHRQQTGLQHQSQQVTCIPCKFATAKPLQSLLETHIDL